MNIFFIFFVFFETFLNFLFYYFFFVLLTRNHNQIDVYFLNFQIRLLVDHTQPDVAVLCLRELLFEVIWMEQHLKKKKMSF
jgi:hypothetical protein